jgi:hypothetical protein
LDIQLSPEARWQRDAPTLLVYDPIQGQGLGILADDSVLSESPDGFGYGKKKLHRVMTGIQRGFQYKKVLARVDHELPKDDQRRLALLANDPGNCSFSATINSASRFSLCISDCLGAQVDNPPILFGEAYR